MKEKKFRNSWRMLSRLEMYEDLLTSLRWFVWIARDRN